MFQTTNQIFGCVNPQNFQTNSMDFADWRDTSEMLPSSYKLVYIGLYSPLPSGND